MDRVLRRKGPIPNPDRGLVIGRSVFQQSKMHHGPMTPTAYRYSHGGPCIGVYDKSGEGFMYRTL